MSRSELSNKLKTPDKLIVKHKETGRQKMAEEPKRSCGSANVALFPCAGAANVGQISNKIAIALEEKGIGNLMCTAGIGARAPGLMKSAEASDRIIAIDGCPVNCASKTLELAGFKVDRQIVISELGIKKTKDRNPKKGEVAEILEKVMRILESE